MVLIYFADYKYQYLNIFLQIYKNLSCRQGFTFLIFSKLAVFIFCDVLVIFHYGSVGGLFIDNKSVIKLETSSFFLSCKHWPLMMIFTFTENELWSSKRMGLYLLSYRRNVLFHYFSLFRFCNKSVTRILFLLGLWQTIWVVLIQSGWQWWHTYTPYSLVTFSMIQ